MASYKSKIALLVIGCMGAMCAGIATAGTSFGTHTATEPATPSDATTLSGSITLGYVGPTWERGNASSSVTLPAFAIADMSDDRKKVTVAIASSGLERGQHAVFSLRTAAGFKGNTAGAGISGVSIS